MKASSSPQGCKSLEPRHWTTCLPSFLVIRWLPHINSPHPFLRLEPTHSKAYAAEMDSFANIYQTYTKAGMLMPPARSTSLLTPLTTRSD